MLGPTAGGLSKVGISYMLVSTVVIRIEKYELNGEFQPSVTAMRTNPALARKLWRVSRRTQDLRLAMRTAFRVSGEVLYKLTPLFPIFCQT